MITFDFTSWLGGGGVLKETGLQSWPPDLSFRGQGHVGGGGGVYRGEGPTQGGLPVY